MSETPQNSFGNDVIQSQWLVYTMMIVIIVALVIAIIYFACKPLRPPVPHCGVGLRGGGFITEGFDKNSDSSSDTMNEEEKENFVLPRAFAVANARRSDKDTRVDPCNVVSSLKDVAERSDGRFFDDFREVDTGMKSAKDSTKKCLDKLATQRMKRGLLRQSALKEEDYKAQSTVPGVSTANQRLNYNGMGSIGTTKVRNNNEMFRNLENVAIDDRGYAQPERFEPCGENSPLACNSRLCGVNMNLNAIAGTMLKKYRSGSVTNPQQEKLTLMNGGPQPLVYDANPDV